MSSKIGIIPRLTAGLASALCLWFSAQLAWAGTSNLPNAPVSYHPDVRITLKTNIGAKGMTFLGVGNGIDGVDNPTLQVPLGAVVQITLIDGDGAEHNIAVPDFNANSDHVLAKDASAVIVFRADKSRDVPLLLRVAGPSPGWMEGKLVVGNADADRAARSHRYQPRPKPTCRRPSEPARRDRACRSQRPWKSRDGLRTGPPITTGPSTAKCRGRC